MWTLADFIKENGATTFVPGRRLGGRRCAGAGAGGCVRGCGMALYRSNTTNDTRIGLTTELLRSTTPIREQLFLGTVDEVLALATDELFAVTGFEAWEGYGAYETNKELLSREKQALGELK
jgi:hypothetical protein